MTRVVAVAVLIAVLPFGGKAHRETEKGNARFEDGDLDAALQAYTEAGVAAPDAPEIQYNIGNVLYRLGDWDGAAEQYARAEASAEPVLRPDASFNLGDALFRREDYAGAAQAFRRALEARPDDEDAKRNLELALRALEADRSRGGPDDGGERSDEEPEPSRGGAPESRPDSGGGEREEAEPRAQEPSPRGDSEGMTEEEARRLLNRLEDEEHDGVRRELKRALAGAETQREKDW